ncbi:30S ribosomal protein S12 methylthiotransferase RimO [Planctomycetota bacterium]|nr:30S ribosomal protein S12 methylthiotransferase RimO [Planctomycetota bacterium]
MTVRPADRVALIHLGCARNLIDSELILGRMAEEGLVVTGDPSEAHTVVLNTCSFIGPAREESHGAIRDLVERKQAGDLGAVVVAGCLVQRYRRTLERQYPDVDMFAEISDYRALARNIRSMSEGEKHQRYLEGPGLREPRREGARLLATPGSYAYLRISHGCDHTCSFCAIPSIRGPHRSKRPSAVLEEAEELIAAGVKELVLVAEDSTAWGRDLGTELPALVESLANLDGDARLRVMYAYPNRFPWDLAPLLAEHPKVLPYLDIPVQHAATPVLRSMRRAGSGDQVRRTLDRLRTEVPDLTLRTTVLLGFPGETDQDAQEVVDLVREFGLSRVGAFTYSPEEGTPGFGLEGSVPEDVAMARRDAVLAERDAQLARTQSEAIGTEVEVLVDEPPDPDGGVIVGRSVHDAPEVDMVTFAEAPEAAVGDRIRVRVEATDEEHNWIATQVDGDRG